MPTSIKLIRSLFIKEAHPEIAKGQSAYLRDQFIFFGIKTPLREVLTKELFKKIPISTEGELVDLIMSLLAQPERELHYVACSFAQKHLKYLTPAFMPTAEYMIRHHSWWDTIDWIAPRILGPLIKVYPEITTIMDQWIDDENFWIARTALLYQLKYKTATDERRLYSYITKRMHDQEFFIRKVIGWMLREYSKTNPDSVRNFIEQHQNTLSNLSIREGSKYL